MTLQLGDIVCFKDPQTPGGGRPLVITFLKGTTLSVRIIRQGLALTYSTSPDDLELLIPSPLGKVLRVKFEDADWQEYEKALNEGSNIIKELGLTRV